MYFKASTIAVLAAFLLPVLAAPVPAPEAEAAPAPEALPEAQPEGVGKYEHYGGQSSLHSLCLHVLCDQ